MQVPQARPGTRYGCSAALLWFSASLTVSVQASVQLQFKFQIRFQLKFQFKFRFRSGFGLAHVRRSGLRFADKDMRQRVNLEQI
jgi:hypothetical protein